jgi:uncharacterized protein
VRYLTAILWGSLVLAASLSPAGALGNEATWTAVVLPKAQQLDVKSAATGFRYRIFVSVPASPAPVNGYPVLYVLDGNAAFPVAAFLGRSAESRHEVTGHQPPIIVGIGYPGDDDFDVAARRRDYTIGTDDSRDAITEGGAERFLDFIEQELKPMLQARYPIDRKRQALFGHSFGGLFVLHALFSRPASFSTFLASSPSIWWQNKRVLGALPVVIKQGISPRIQISVGALEDTPPKGNYPPEIRALMASRTMIPEARELAEKLQHIPGLEDKVVYHELAGEDHGPAWLPAMTRGMQFFLEQP